MTLSELTLLAVGAAACLTVAIYFFQLPAATEAEQVLSERLAVFDDRGFTDYVSGGGDATSHDNALNSLRERFDNIGGSSFKRSDRAQSLHATLMRANLKIKPVEWLGITVLVMAVMGLLLVMRFGAPLFFPIGAALGYFGCGFFLRFRTNGRRKAFDNQLSPTLMAIGNGLKAGYTFAQAIDLVSKSSPDPMREELTRVVRETQLGRPIIEAIGKMVERNDSEELRLLFQAVTIQAQTGANLAKIIDKIEFTIRDRIRIKGEIKTLTGQARASGWILIILPFALAGILTMIAPDYFKPMFSHLVGQIFLGASLFMVACGYGIIRKIVNIQV